MRGVTAGASSSPVCLSAPRWLDGWGEACFWLDSTAFVKWFHPFVATGFVLLGLCKPTVMISLRAGKLEAVPSNGLVAA